jgi:hypothetical protein
MRRRKAGKDSENLICLNQPKAAPASIVSPVELFEKAHSPPFAGTVQQRGSVYLAMAPFSRFKRRLDLSLISFKRKPF